MIERPSSIGRSDPAIGPPAERAMIERIERVASTRELGEYIGWRNPGATPLADLRELAKRVREKYSEPEFYVGPRPILLHRLGHEVSAYPGTIDQLLAQLAEQGAPSPQPVVVRGTEGYQVGQMVALSSELGVIVGTAAGVSGLLDREGP